MLRSTHGFTLLEFAIVLIFILIIAAILFPVFMRAKEPTIKPSCQNNLKELATAIQMYWNDYDGYLPSSVLRLQKGSATWDAAESAKFCSQRGKIPPDARPAPQNVSWVSILWPYMKNKDIIWCPSDPNRDPSMASHNDPASMSGMVTYIYKPAIDCAWFNTPLPADPETPNSPIKMMNFRKAEDFVYVADQMIFFEHTGWHWGDANKGWSSNDKGAVTLNAAFLDGHVRAVRLKHAIGCPTPRNCNELAGRMSLAGEPIWYNTQSLDNGNKITSGVYKWFDPRVCYDDLP